MKERGKYQIQCMKSRSSQGVGQKIELEYDNNTMRISDAGGENQHNSAGKPSIYDSIKKNPKNDENSDSEQPVVKADVQSKKLSELLGKIKAGG